MKKNEFAIASIPTGKLNALVKNIMRQMGEKSPEEAIRKLNSGMWVVTEPKRCWIEEKDTIRITVVSNGMTGEEWIQHFVSKKINVGDEARKVLLSPDFTPTAGIRTDVVILKGDLFFKHHRFVDQIYAEAETRKLIKPSAEVTCLIRDMVSDNEIKMMELNNIVVMHEYIKVDETNFLLNVTHAFSEKSYLSAHSEYGYHFSEHQGFAFAIPPAS